VNEHTGVHEYKDGKRFNLECLLCMVDNRDFLRFQFQHALRELIVRLRNEPH